MVSEAYIAQSASPMSSSTVHFWTPRLRWMSLIKSYLLVSVWHLPTWLRKIKLSGLCDWEEIMRGEVYAAWLALLLSFVTVTCVWGCRSSILWMKKTSTVQANSYNFTSVDGTYSRTALSSGHFIVTELSFSPSLSVACPASYAPSASFIWFIAKSLGKLKLQLWSKQWLQGPWHAHTSPV